MKKRLQKRLLAFLLTLTMMLGLLPATALAAVGDLMGNSGEENQALLDELSQMTGGDSGQVRAVLDGMGLLDEDGELNLSQSIRLDGEELTLEQAMSLLDDPDVDLARMADVDGTPISLGDLKTILQIERKLSRIQDTYFSGRTFTGESLDDLNSLMDQIETEGITLRDGDSAQTNVLDLLDSWNMDVEIQPLMGGSAQGEGDSSSITIPAGQTVSFFWKELGGIIDEFGRSFHNWGAQLYVNNEKVPEGQVTLTADADADTTFDIGVMVNINQIYAGDYHGLSGTLQGYVEFYNPANMIFHTKDSFTDTARISVRIEKPYAFYYDTWDYGDWTTWARCARRYPRMEDNDVNEPRWPLVPLLYTSGLDPTSPLDDTATQILGEDGVRVYEVDAMLAIWGFDLPKGSKDDPWDGAYMTDAMPIPTRDGVPLDVVQYTWQSVYGGPTLDIKLGQDGTPNYGTSFLKPKIHISHTIDEEQDLTNWTGDKVQIVVSAQGAGTVPNELRSVWGTPRFLSVTSNSEVQLLRKTKYHAASAQAIGGIGATGEDIFASVRLRDTTAPTLTSFSVPKGSYQSGQLVPITLDFSEPVDAGALTLSINGSDYSAAELGMDTTGKKAMAWYPVLDVDDAELTITDITGAEDLCGNAMDTRTFQAYTAEGVELESTLMRNSVHSVSASYANGAAAIALDVDQAQAYRQKYSDETISGGYTSFQAVVTDPRGGVQTLDFTLTEPSPNTIVPVAEVTGLMPTTAEQTCTVSIRAFESADDATGTLLYGKEAAFTVPPKRDVTGVTIAASPALEALSTLSLAEDARPVLTVALAPADADYTTGAWSSSDADIARVERVNGADAVATGSKVGAVTLTYTADNGTPEDPDDDRSASISYTVVAGGSPALVIPSAASTIVARQNSPATVLWSSNAAAFTAQDFVYTVEVFAGSYPTGEELQAALDGEAPPSRVWTTTVAKDKNSAVIPEDTLADLSAGATPAYTVRVSMPHPKASNDTLTALCWIVVDPQAAGAGLMPPGSLYLTDDQTVSIGWSVENFVPGVTDGTLTITRITGDDDSSLYAQQPLDTATGIYPFTPEAVSGLKETYMVAMSVQNTGSAPDVDAFPLYVYRAGALSLQAADGAELGSSLTMDNTSKVTGYAGGGGGAATIQALREELSLIEYVGINYGDYSWSQLTDRIKWQTSDPDVSVNYKQGGLYENIDLFTMDTYLPETKLALSSVTDGTATITATHANTGMSDSVDVDVHTLRDQFYLFQLTPMLKTTLTYTDGTSAPKTIETDDDGMLALYEPSGIASDVSLKATDAQGNVYLGTMYKEDLLSGERDATKLQLYPLNVFKLRQVAQVALSITKPDGSPFSGSVTLRGGVYKNGGYCQAALLGGSADDLRSGEADQTMTVSQGSLTVYLDSTQFWSKEKGETSADAADLTARDDLQYIFELSDLSGVAYYPVLVYANGNLTTQDVMRSAGSVLTLESVPAGQAEKPFLSNQTMDYGLTGGRLVDVRGTTGHVGPNSAYPTATLRSTMLLWGESDLTAGGFAVQLTDEYRYVPSSQTSKMGTYPFSSIPVAYNDLTLTEAAITDSGWVPRDKDMGLRLRLNQGNTLLLEQALPFRLMDMTRVEKVTESENVSNMLVTLKSSSALGASASGSDKNKVTNTIMGLMGDLSGPVNGSNFKMIISPSEDNTKFNAFIWAGYDSVGLDEIDYSSTGLALDHGLMETSLSVAPSIGDMAEMAKGEETSQVSEEDARKGQGSGEWDKSVEFGGQLEGYYEAEIAYNFKESKWEIYTLGGGFTAGFSGGMTFGISTFAGPVPLFAEFGFGGAVQLDFKTAVRYSEQNGLTWADTVTGDTVNDYLTTLRLNAYIDAFGGIGFDYSIVALKIGLFGEVKADNSNRFLSRTYLADPAQRQLNGQRLEINGTVGVKFVARFVIFTVQTVVASGSAGYSHNFNDMAYINDYWENTGSGRPVMRSAAQYAAQNGLSVASSTVELQARDYLEQYDRTWYGGAMRPMLMAMDDPNAVEPLQDNADPTSFPVVTDDGQLLLYVSDGSSSSIYDSRVYATALSGGSYAEGGKIADPAGFDGYGDSGVALAGGGSFAAAAWVRLANQIEGKDSGSAVTLAEQNLLMNGAEIVVSAYNGSEWESTRLTDNATPDLAPAVAVGGGKAIAAWRSVYAADPGTAGNDGENNLLNFTAKDTVLYSIYDGSGWSAAQELYNGSAGAVKALQAAMLPDGTAAVVYTLDRDGADGSSADYEIAYTMVDKDGALGSTMIATSDNNVDENPQIVAAGIGNGERFVIGWRSIRDGASDIHLLAVNGEGAMSNNFPSAISQVVEQNAVTIGGEFRFAGMDGSHNDLDHLVILWPEPMSDAATGAPDHSVLKAVKFRTTAGGVGLSAPLEVAELPARTMLDHFDAYVSGDDQIKAVLQGTWYDPDNSETIEGVSVPQEKSMLFTATGDFIDRATVTSILPDYADLALNSQTAIQFTLFNAGSEDLTAAKITLDGTDYSFDGLTLAPNESTILTVWHPVGGEVKNLPYTVTADFETGSQVTADSGTVHLDYPDVGISQMELVSESEGMRRVRMTLYNQSAATLAGDKNRGVTLSFCTDGLYSALVDVTAATTAGVSIDPATKVLTISSEDDLALIDQGAFTLELAFDVGAYVAAMTDVEGKPLTEIPDGGVRLFAKASVLEGAKTLPEYSSSNNESNIRFDSLLKRTNEAVTLGVEQGTSGGASTASIALRNNSLQPQSTGGAVIATLLDARGNVLEQKQTGINAAELIGEGSKKADVAFTKSGSRVTATYGVLADDSNSTNLSDLRFEGLPVSLSDFTMDADGNYAASVTTQAASTLVSFVAAGTAASVTVNGAASTGSTKVDLPGGTSTISVKVTAGGADRTYVLTVQRTGGGSGGTVAYTLRFETNGGSAISALRRSGGTVVDLSGYTPTRTDHTFAGWYSDVALTTKITSVKLTKNITIYAGWTTAEMPFADVAADTYYYDAVLWAVEKGVTSGTSATTFAPNATCTRAETVTFLWRAMGSPEPTTAVDPFTDVAADAYYYKAVLWAVEKGVTKGTSDTTFSPDMDCSRAQVVTFLYRAAGSPTAAVSLTFTDVAVDAYYAQAVAWAAGENVTAGTGDHKFSPDSPCTRAQIVTLLYRHLIK